MKKILPVFGLMLFLFSCKKDKVEPKPEPRFYLTETNRTASNTSDQFTIKYTYNTKNQVIRVDFLKNNTLERYHLYSYNEAGKLSQKRVFGSTNLFLEQDEMEYNAANIPVKLSHSYINANGVANLHHIRRYTFDASGRIIKWTEYEPDNTLITGRSYVYKSNNEVESIGTGRKNEFIDKFVITYDNRKTPFAETNFQVLTFPGNELNVEIKDVNERVVDGYSNSFVYNEKGYPVKLTQTQADGTVKTETYTYKTE